MSDSEVEDYEEESYAMLKAGKHRIRNPDGTFRCPFCTGKKKQDYQFKDLLQHATGIGASSSCSRKGSLKAHHRAFARFLQHDLAPSLSLPLAVLKEAAAAAATPALLNHPTPSSSPSASAPKPSGDDNLFVWPWMGILVNASPSAAEGSDFREQLSDFDLIDTVLLQEGDDYLSKAAVIVKFNSGWDGFKNAMDFDNHFSAGRHGKEEWAKLQGGDASGILYGWVARADDYNAEGAIGRHLKKHGNLKTIEQVMEEESKKAGRKVADLADKLDTKNQHLRDLEVRYNTMNLSLRHVMDEKDRLHLAYNERMPLPLLNLLFFSNFSWQLALSYIHEQILHGRK